MCSTHDFVDLDLNTNSYANIPRQDSNIGGMLLKDSIKDSIRNKDIVISPYNESLLNPNSINLTLAPELQVYDIARTWWQKLLSPFTKKKSYIDMMSKNPVKTLVIPETGLLLKPGILYIGSTNETTSSLKHIPQINGRSSTGRLGFSIHETAGFGDLGFTGTWTLEITVVEPLMVYPHQPVCQVCYFTPVGDVNNLSNHYRGRYYKQEGPTSSRMYLGPNVYKTEGE